MAGGASGRRPQQCVGGTLQLPDRHPFWKLLRDDLVETRN